MAVTTSQRPASLIGGSGNRGDSIFKTLTVIFAALIIVIVAAFAIILVINSTTALSKSGLNFITSNDWSPADNKFGALVFIYDTLVTSVIALFIGGLVSLGVAIFLSEYAPDWLRTPISFVVELLAAIPSVIFGLWGVATLAPFMGGLDGFLNTNFGFVPMFGGGFDGSAPTPLANGRNLLTAGIVLSIMIIPTVASISRDVLRTVPDSQREGFLALGATKWQTIRKAVLPAGRRGIIGALILGFGRAVGETVAVSYLVGGAQNAFPPSGQIYETGETMATKIANSRSEALGASFSALLALGLVLFLITLVVNGLALRLVRSGVKTVRAHAASADEGKSIFSQIGTWFGRLLFPIIILLLFPYLSIPVSLIIVVIWAAYRLLKVWNVRSQEAGKPLPHLLAILAEPQASFNYRKNMNNIMQGVMAFAMILAIVPLVSILILVVVNGLGAMLSPDFLVATQDGRNIFDQSKVVASGNDGISNAILGTLVIVAVSSVIGIPIGMLAGIYLSEYGNNAFGGAVRFTANVLNSIPSIIVGLFGLSVFVNNHIFAQDYSGWAGAVVLAVMMVPIISRNTEEVLRLVPVSLREAALGLGLPQWRVTLTMVIPSATGAIVTGILLGVARIAGETAPLLLTASTSSNWRSPMSGPTSALTTYIYANISGDPTQQQHAWGAALAIVVLVFVLVFGIRFLTRSRLRTSL